MDTRIQKAYDIIKKGYQEKLLLADLADSVNLSPFFFQRLFKREMNETPAACISRIRLERAAHLMRIDPDLPMGKIAIDCGFSSLSTFSRAFSLYYSMSPIAYSRLKADYGRFEKAAENLHVEIVYHPGATLLYSHISFYQPGLLKSFAAVKSFCEINNILLQNNGSAF
jgi:AraC-like DNA-binding protein